MKAMYFTDLAEKVRLCNVFYNEINALGKGSEKNEEMVFPHVGANLPKPPSRDGSGNFFTFT